MILNPIYYGKGGSAPILLVTVKALEPTAVTATLGASTVSLSKTASGPWMGVLPKTGDWTITATDGTYTNAKTVTVTGSAASVEIVLFPPGYTPLEYIQATGTQYINTGYVPKTGETSVKVAFAINSAEDYNGVFGARTDYYANTALYFGCRSDGGTYAGIGGNYKTTLGYPWSLAQKYVVVADPARGIVINNTLIELPAKANVSVGHNLFVLAQNQNAEPIEQAKAQLYACLVSDSGGIRRNLGPARRNLDSAIGMVDLANNAEWYGNAGTGVFIAGPEI